MQYRLTRKDGVPELPAWWNAGGTAFHECIREWETEAASPVGTRTAGRTPDEQAERFPHFLAEATADIVIKTGKGPHEWRTGGRASQQYPNKEDRSWWLDNGPEMVAKYVQAQEGREFEILRLPPQAPPEVPVLALELGFLWHPELGELPPLKGFIDQVLYFPRSDQIIVRDLKAGSSTPVDTFQLKVYRLALERVFGITARKWWGDYWLGRKGVATQGLDLTNSLKVEAEVRYRLHAMDTAETLHLYPPNPGISCSSCGVKAHCPAMSDEPFATWQPGAVAVDAPTS